VGKAKNLKSRVSSYFGSSAGLGIKTAQLVTHIAFIQITQVDSELEALLLEAFYIKKFAPKYNIRLTDNKSYPLIRITVKDTYPAVLTARQVDDPKSVYFGPFPSASTVRMVLRVLRRIFPYHSTTNHPKHACLYHHLGLCPCLPAYDTQENRAAYKKNIKRIIRILEGEVRSLIKELETERDSASKSEEFENALILQKQIDALSYITQPFHSPVDYHVNPNLREDLRLSEMQELQTILQKAGYTTMPLPEKIECYDISHFQGKLTVASMVVFMHGEKDGSLYRKYKIQHEKTPDDFMSMREVLTRRLKHTEWEYPDLFIVDGGKGQVSSALEVFNEKGITIPLIGLAKREEHIVVPLRHPRIDSKQVIEGKGKKDEAFLEIALSKRAKASLLVQRIRDEAHRFAITYHRLLRSKALVGEK
jgi:excinuclease ABC subunit C